MDILTRIDELCSKKSWTHYKLSKEMDKPANYIHDLFKRNNTPTISNLEKMCEVLDITLAQFFAGDGEAVILTESQKRILDAYFCLNPNQKQLFMTYLSGLADLPADPEMDPDE